MRQPSFELHSKVDEDGFVAVVCPDEYSGYVGEDWTLQQMLGRFTEQMNNGTLFAVCPGPDLADMPLRIADAPSELNAQREVSGLLRVHNGGAWLTDYGQLTMAAQFSDEPPLSPFHIRLPLRPGEYRATFRQFARSYEDRVEPAAELVIRSAEPGDNPSKFDALPWFG
ncbi:hypothetical protein ACU4GI_40110 [Cupriavidus basilensis]